MLDRSGAHQFQNVDTVVVMGFRLFTRFLVKAMLIRQVVPAFAWFIVALSLLPASLATALGQEPPAAPPATSEPEAAPIETDDPATAPDEETWKRRLFKRLGPQALTPEEQREAARLSRIAAKQGTDPTAILGGSRWRMS